MRLGPRAKLLLVASIFALPIVASYVAYLYFPPKPTANYGELLLPPSQAPALAFREIGGGAFTFASLQGGWAMVASDAAACGKACIDKLVMMRQVRLALGRDAARVTRVLIVEDGRAPEPALLEPFQGTVVLLPPAGSRLPPGPGNDRGHVYLVDPHGNVMMRWPAPDDGKGMLKDLQRLLKASQIG